MNKAVVSSEPVAAEIIFGDDEYQLKLLLAFNWFNLEKDRKDARKYIEDYCKKHNIPIRSLTDSEVNLTMGWVCRVMLKGAQLSTDHQRALNRYLNKLTPLPQVQKIVTAPKVNIQEATQNRIAAYIGELEGVIDNLAKDPKTPFSLLDDMKKNEMPQASSDEIREWVKSKLREPIEVLEGKDKDLIEGYSNFKKKDLVAFAKRLASFLEEAEKYSAFKKANRKPRAKKVKSPTLQVKDLKYKSQDDQLKITSVSPTEIVGAMQVWVFNTKTRKLAVYRTESSSGIQVKGTTLQNYEPEQSVQKTVRKPEIVLQDLLKAGKVQLRKFMDGIKAVDSQPNGRLNADTLIVRAIK